MLISVIQQCDTSKRLFYHIRKIMETYQTEEVEIYYMTNKVEVNFGKHIADQILEDSYLFIFNSEVSFDRTIFKHINKINAKRKTRTFFTLNAINHLLKIENPNLTDVTHEHLDWERYKNSLIMNSNNVLTEYRIMFLGNLSRFVKKNY